MAKVLFKYSSYKTVTTDNLGWGKDDYEEANADYYDDPLEFHWRRGEELEFIYKEQLYMLERLYYDSIPKHILPNGDIDWKNCEYSHVSMIVKFHIDPDWDGKYLIDKFLPYSADYFKFCDKEEDFYKTANIDGIPLSEVVKQSYIVRVG